MSPAEEMSAAYHALARKVVCCSPLTLFALLAVIRQAVDAFAAAGPLATSSPHPSSTCSPTWAV